MNSEVVIIIPTLNEEAFIARCLDSVRNQLYPFEMMDVLIVDGGSDDKTRQIVERQHRVWPNIRLIDNPKRIQSAAFNIGVQNSVAPYIIRLDAHVTYDKNYVKLCLKHLKSDFIYGNVGGVCVIKSPKNTLVANTNMILNQSLFGIGGAKFRIGSEPNFVDTVPFGAFRRDVINKVGGMREDLPRAEDNEFNSRLRKCGFKIFLDPQIVSYYYARDTFLGSLKQMYNNGVSIGHLFYIDKNAIGIRHFVPFLFVSGLIGGLILSFFSKWILYIFIIALALYLVLNIAATVYECRKFGWKYLLTLPFMFISVHIIYGTGTIVGLFETGGPKMK